MTYAWQDKLHALQETKFGDHYIQEECSDKEAIQHTLDYVRTQFPRRGKYFDSDAVLKHVWDVTKIAEKEKRFYHHSHIDDIIGSAAIGRRGTAQGGEFHPYEFNEVVYKINRYIAKTGQPLPMLSLAPWQGDIAENMLTALSEGKRTILAELACRFGKTLFAGALTLETNINLTIVASYVLTSFSSFAKDLSEFEQFRDFEIIDSAGTNFEVEVSDALKSGKQVIVFLSMCGSTKRQNRIDYLFALDVRRMCFIDEADYGAHTEKQTDPFIAARKKDDIICLLTGTNGERACGNWTIDHYMGMTYAEMLMYRFII